MRILYFIVTSSIMIGLMLLIRSAFRKKLSASVIYTLWLILYFRLLLPFGYWELPLFGTAADITYRPAVIVEQLFEKSENQPSENINIYQEESAYEASATFTKPTSGGVKVYDAVVPETPVITENAEPTEHIVPEQTTTIYHPKVIILSIWFAGSLIAAGYVILQNRKLQKEVNKLEIIGKIDSLDICVSKDLKTPCLFGVRKPKLIVTEAVLADSTLYEYAITHELEHYKYKDHIWNAERIFICILYWWNPLVWYAAKCVAEDAELACDERVLKNKSVEERKNYGYALLQMIENVQNKPLCFATSFSGSKNSMKLRIEAIANKSTTKKYIFFPVLLSLMILLVAGCVYPSEKSYIKATDWKNGETDELTYNEANYEYSLQDNFQSMLFYYETYEYGELTERKILAHGGLEKYSDILLLRDESCKYETKRNFIVEMNGIEITMPVLRDIPGAYAISHIYCENELLEISAGDDIILMAAYQTKDSVSTELLSCEILTSYEEEELKNILHKNSVVTLGRLVLSDLPAETLYKQMQTKEFPIEGKSVNGRTVAEDWANAFVAKNIDALLALATDSVRQQLLEAQILSEDLTSFGWSSPWPGLFTEESYKILQSDNTSAEILYYASISTPQVIVWKETLKFENHQISTWTLERYEEISNLEDYHSAYPKNEISNTPMDYYTNGLGFTLNQNALLSSSTEYQSLFDAGTAALELLNISKDYSQVHYNVNGSDEEAMVSVWFLNRDGSVSGVHVTMWQPYGKEGIWIPKSESAETGLMEDF